MLSLREWRGSVFVLGGGAHCSTLETGPGQERGWSLGQYFRPDAKSRLSGNDPDAGKD